MPPTDSRQWAVGSRRCEVVCFSHRRLISFRPAGPDYVTVSMKSCTKGSRRNNFTFWRERRAGRCEAPRRRRCGDIVEERQQRRYAPFAAAPLRAAARRAAGRRFPLALLLAPHIRPGYCSSLAPCQRAWGPAAKCEVISARALSLPRPVSLKAALPRRWQQRYEGQEGFGGVKSGSDYDIKADCMGCRRKPLVKTNERAMSRFLFTPDQRRSYLYRVSSTQVIGSKQI